MDSRDLAHRMLNRLERNKMCGTRMYRVLAYHQTKDVLWCEGNLDLVVEKMYPLYLDLVDAKRSKPRRRMALENIREWRSNG